MKYHKLQLLKSTTFPSFSVTFFSSDFRSRERGFSLSSNTELSHRVIPNSYFKSSTVQKCLDLGFWLTHHKAVITWLWPAEAQVLYNPSKFQNVMIKGFHLTLILKRFHWYDSIKSRSILFHLKLGTSLITMNKNVNMRNTLVNLHFPLLPEYTHAVVFFFLWNYCVPITSSSC